MRITSENKRIHHLVILVLIVLLLIPIVTANVVFAAAKTVTVLDGQVSVTDNNGTGSVSGGTVTITAKGSIISKATNEITITNETENTATLSFDYSADKASSFTIAGATAATSGSYTVVLDAGGSLAIELVSKSGFSNTTATLTMSNFSLTVAADSSNVTIEYNSALGSVTADGSAVASGTIQNVSLADGVALVATANSGTTFLGWVDADGKILSTSASYTLKPAADTTIKAAFAKDGVTLWFGVAGATPQSESMGFLGAGGTVNYYTVSTQYAFLFDDLNAAAATAAVSANAKYIVPLVNCTLTAGEYTIPSGVTLLIPFDDNNTLYTTTAQSIGTYTTPTAYRTLTLADGAKLIIDGSLSISAKHRYTEGDSDRIYGGAPTGKVGFLRMQENSTITVNNGGALYAYGYITGSGEVIANSGASIYELFQFTDFRGGSQTSDMKTGTKANGVFPLSQYYVQNVEVPLKLYAGAKEYCYTSANMTGGPFHSSIEFIGPSNGMFRINSGYCIKRYDGSKDRLVIESYGDVVLSNITVKIATETIESAGYELPLNSNITVIAQTGSMTVNQDVAMQPGSEIVINSNVTCTLGSGISIYIYDRDQWGNYCGAGNVRFTAVPYAPGRTYTRKDADLVDAKVIVNGTFDASLGYLYTTAGGANITSEGGGVVKMKAGEQTITHQLVQGTGYTEIPITPARLQNSNNTYTETSDITEATTYTYINGFWHKGTACIPGAAATCTTAQTCTVCGEVVKAALGHTEVIDAAVAATCTETGLTEGKHCSVCNEVIVAQTVVAATGHSYDDGVVTTPPTCTEKGIKTYTCGTCSHSYTEEIAANGHQYNAVVTPPTCTAEGYTTYTCTTCGDTYVDDTVASTGHSYSSEVTKEPTCTEKGEKTYTCGTCGDTYTEDVAALGHVDILDAEKEENPDSICDRCDLILFHGINVNLGNNLDMLFAFSKAAADSKNASYVVFTRNGVDSDPVPISSWRVQGIADGESVAGDAFYVVTYGGFAAKEMCDYVTVTVYDASNNIISVSRTDSIRDYAHRVLDSTDIDSLKALIKAMLNYGAACQVQFNYNASTEQLANYRLDEGDREIYEHIETSNDFAVDTTADIGIAARNLIVDSHISFWVAFNGDLSGYKNVYFDGTGHKGNSLGGSAELQDGKYIIITNLVVADYQKEITITIGENEMTTSIQDYLDTMQKNDVNDVFDAFGKFAASAHAYLHRNDTTEGTE